MHIKFLAHGKGSAAHASSYVLDKFDHQGNIRAGVEVLRGDATTFNALCDASPHLWKYTSGVIAWAKEDDPKPKQQKTGLILLSVSSKSKALSRSGKAKIF